MKKLNLLLLLVLIIAVFAMFALFKHLGDKKQTKIAYPFYVSTKYVTSNIRSGPGKEFPILWVYQQKRTPIKVLVGYNNWYQIEDYSGKIGWIFQNTVSKEATAFTNQKVSVYNKPNVKSRVLASIDKNLIVILKKADDSNTYYKINLDLGNVKVSGWVLKEQLWGKLNNN